MLTLFQLNVVSMAEMPKMLFSVQRKYISLNKLEIDLQMGQALTSCLMFDGYSVGAQFFVD